MHIINTHTHTAIFFSPWLLLFITIAVTSIAPPRPFSSYSYCHAHSLSPVTLPVTTTLLMSTTLNIAAIATLLVTVGLNRYVGVDIAVDSLRHFVDQRLMMDKINDTQRRKVRSEEHTSELQSL